jgi:ubiquinone/menaquinone biosynthesis C-methylase UbiE
MRERRLTWEERWTSHEGASFTWDTGEVPNELRALIDDRTVSDGSALDLGCGTSVVTAYLARFFSPTIGIDLAFDATRQAKELARKSEPVPDFVVGDAVELPLASSSLSFVFDRGCLQNVRF